MEKLNYASCDIKKFVYITQKGDSISSLSNKFNTTENLIIRDNNLTEEIKLGKYLIIERYKEIYQVKITDTLTSISNEFNLPVEEIKKINKIDYVYPGLKLVIR